MLTASQQQAISAFAELLLVYVFGDSCSLWRLISILLCDI